MEDRTARRIIRNFVLEMVIYAALVSAYFLLVLRYLGDWLYELYHSELQTYAFLALALIVAQAVVLEAITSFLITRLGLERLE
jgi:hypothetical protein